MSPPLAPHLRKKVAKQANNQEQSPVPAANTNNANVSTNSVSSPTASTSDAATSRPSSRALAVIPHGIEEAYSPMELIQHETVRTLQSLLDASQADLQASHSRCDDLEAENERLRQQLSEGFKSEEPSFIKSTLCGYESSEEAASPSPEPELSANERINIMTEILEKQAAQQAKMEETIATQAEQLKDLTSTINNAKSNQRQATEETKPTPSALEIHSLSEDVKGFKISLAKLEQHRRGAKFFQMITERKTRQERRIDQAVIRENLLEIYETLSSRIENPNSKGDPEWEGSEDDLWALRDRVVRRLATFDACGKAQEEARALMEYNGKVSSSSPPVGKKASNWKW